MAPHPDADGVPEQSFGERRKWQRDLTDALREIRESDPRAPSRTKTIYFVRHAQSRSNVARARMSSARLRGAVQLCSAGFNSSLSPIGLEQLLQVRPVARRFGEGLEAVLFSPLQRATQTALALFGDEDADDEFSPPEDKFWRPVRALKETRFKEHAEETFVRSQSILQERVLAFIRFVSLLPWERFALVGHSRFFRAMLQAMGEEVRLGNASIWRVQASMRQGVGLCCDTRMLVAQPAGGGSATLVSESEAEVEGDRGRGGGSGRSSDDSDAEAEEAVRAKVEAGSVPGAFPAPVQAVQAKVVLDRVQRL